MTTKFVDELDHTKWSCNYSRQVCYIPIPTKYFGDTARGNEVYSEKAWEEYVAAWRDAQHKDLEPQLKSLILLADIIRSNQTRIYSGERETIFTIYGEFDYSNRYPDLIGIRTQLCPEGRFQKYHVPVSNTDLAMSVIQNAIQCELANVLYDLEHLDTLTPEFTTITLVGEK